jgi:hypothetical protein
MGRRRRGCAIAAKTARRENSRRGSGWASRTSMGPPSESGTEAPRSRAPIVPGTTRGASPMPSSHVQENYEVRSRARFAGPPICPTLRRDTRWMVVWPAPAPGTLAAPALVGPGGRNPLDHLASPPYRGGDMATAVVPSARGLRPGAQPAPKASRRARISTVFRPMARSAAGGPGAAWCACPGLPRAGHPKPSAWSRSCCMSSWWSQCPAWVPRNASGATGDWPRDFSATSAQPLPHRLGRLRACGECSDKLLQAPDSVTRTQLGPSQTSLFARMPKPRGRGSLKRRVITDIVRMPVLA